MPADQPVQNGTLIGGSMRHVVIEGAQWFGPGDYPAVVINSGPPPCLRDRAAPCLDGCELR